MGQCMCQYDSETYRKFAKEWCFDHVTSSSHYPKSNGFIEHTIKTVKMTLKEAKSSKLDPYLALLCIRTTPIDYVRNVRNRVPMLWKHKMEGCCEKIGDTYEK